MKKAHPTRLELLALNQELQAKLAEAEEIIEAIRTGSVDALVLSSERGEEAFTLQGSDHAYQLLVEAMKEGAVTVGSDGTIYYCNSRFAEMMSCPIEQITGSNIEPYLHESDREAFRLLFKHGLTASSRGEVALRAADDTILPVYLSLNSLSIYQVPAVCVVVTDLTEQKRSEEIIAAEKLARSILSQAAEAIVVADENGRIIRASRAAEEMCGEQLALRSFNDVFNLHDAEGQEIRFAALAGDGPRVDTQSDLLKRAMDGKVAQGIEVTLAKDNGESRSLLLSAGPVLNSQSDIMGCTVTLTDITKMKQVEAELKRARDQADEANRAKTAFLANMSHEIRTPLGAVLGFAELLATPDLSAAQRDDFITKVKRNGHQLSSLIDDILDLSRVESGRLQIELVEFSLREVLHDVMSAVKYRVMEKPIALHVASDGTIPKMVWSDPFRLKQILTNVLGNAVKFTDSGHVTMTASCPDAAASRPNLVFAIEDTGCGLTLAQGQSLFEPFKQADSSTTRKFGGTGLGLALSRGLARALGGDLILDQSAPRQGCRFVATIAPELISGEIVIRSLSDLEIAAAPQATPTARDVRLEGTRILLVEDAPDNQLLVSRFLKMAGAQVDVADNGEVALALVAREAYHLVLMDIQMPVLDGLEATTRLRELGYKTPIVALTAHALKEERDRCLRVGCNGHLTKPVNRIALLETVERFAKRASG